MVKETASTFALVLPVDNSLNIIKTKTFNLLFISRQDKPYPISTACDFIRSQNTSASGHFLFVRTEEERIHRFFSSE